MEQEQIKEQIKGLKEDLKVSENNLSALYIEQSNIEQNIEYEEQNKDGLIGLICDLEEKLLHIQTPEEQLPYWVDKMSCPDRPNIDGQFTFDKNKWYLTNGFVIIELNKKLDFLKECKGLRQEDMERWLKEENLTSCKIDLDFIEDDDNAETLTIQNSCIIDIFFFKLAKHILQLTNDDKFFIKEMKGRRENTNCLLCKNKNGRALILGRRW